MNDVTHVTIKKSENSTWVECIVNKTHVKFYSKNLQNFVLSGGLSNSKMPLL